jgi:hypothetical protein
MEVVTENTRIPADQEIITGSYKAPREGALVLIFDNTYSWFTPKLLTYHAEMCLVRIMLVFLVICVLTSVLQPPLAALDTSRCIQCYNLLQVVVNDTKHAKHSLAGMGLKAADLRNSINKIGTFANACAQSTVHAFAAESVLATMLADLERKQFELASVIDETEGLTEKLKNNKSRIPGLCIRCLDRNLLRLVLSYVGGPRSSASSVCKYWLKCSSPDVVSSVSDKLVDGNP